MTELLPAFLDALLTKGRIKAECGFCGTLHICLDDPGDPLPEIKVDEGVVVKPTKEGIQSAIRGFESQGQYGVNSCYFTEDLVDYLYRIDDDLTDQERVERTFRCSEETAAKLLQRYPRPDDSEIVIGSVVAHFEQNIMTGTLDGKVVVEGCCKETQRRYQNFALGGMLLISKFLENHLKSIRDDAQEDLLVAEDIVDNVNEIMTE